MSGVRSRVLRRWLGPATRFALRRAVHRARDGADRAQLWQWERAELRGGAGLPLDVVFIGRRSQRWRAASLLGLHGDEPGVGGEALLVSEVPVPYALRVPWTVHAVVPLGRSVEAILAGYDSELRRRLRKQSAAAALRPVANDGDLERVYAEHLVPYAVARHGEDAVMPTLDAVRRIARGDGRLDVVTSRGTEVASHLGYPLEHAAKRRWVTLRFGYPRAVFDDPRRLRDANSLNAHLALVSAVEAGFDTYDLGSCTARPDDGLLQWKRRRGGQLDLLLNEGVFWVRPPSERWPELLWHAPLFSVDRGGLALRLGLPNGPADEDAVTRFRELGYGGLAAIHLHAGRRPGATLMAALRALYAERPDPPAIHVHLT